MKKFSVTITAISVLLPGFAAAQQSIESYVERMIENATQSGGTVIIENHSSVSTGGQVAGAGETIVTDGDVSSSSHTETRINAGNDGGSVYVKTETKRNGEIEKKEEYTKAIDPGAPVEVNVSAHSDDEGSEVSTEIQGESMDTQDSSAENPEEEVTIAARFESAFKTVPSFFKKVFSFFWGW